MYTGAGLKHSFFITGEGLEIAMPELKQLKAAAEITCKDTNISPFIHRPCFDQIRYFRLNTHLCAQ